MFVEDMRVMFLEEGFDNINFGVMLVNVLFVGCMFVLDFLCFFVGNWMMVSIKEENMRVLREVSGAINDNEVLSVYLWLVLVDLCDFLKGVLLEYVIVVSG